MVSFQCHSCGDVVKKPKLDQHRSRCHGGFDCIDCSTTFKTPAEYKGHTSCISEAEKYQKSLFKGPKKGGNGQSNNNQTQTLPQHKSETVEPPASRQSNAQWNRISQTTSLNNVNGYPGPQHIQSQPQWQNGRNNNNDRYTNGRGGRERRPPRPSATGANDTPLGTPRRTSPAGFGSSMAPVVKPNAGHVDRAPESVSTQMETRQYLVGVDKVGKKSGKEDTKCKPEDLKIRENLVDVFPSAIEERPSTKDKKRKSQKGEPDAVASNKDEDIPEMERHKKKREEKEEKRKRKDPELGTEDTETAAPSKKEKKRNDKKLNGEAATNKETAITIGDIETAEPGKKQKRRKEKKVNGTIDSTGGEVEMATGVDTKRKEKRRREKGTDAVKTDLEQDLEAEDERKAHKKRKLQADGVESRKKKRKEEKTTTAEAT